MAYSMSLKIGKIVVGPNEFASGSPIKPFSFKIAVIIIQFIVVNPSSISINSIFLFAK